MEVTHEDIDFALPGGKVLDIPPQPSAAERGDSGDGGAVISPPPPQQQQQETEAEPEEEDVSMLTMSITSIKAFRAK